MNLHIVLAFDLTGRCFQRVPIACDEREVESLPRQHLGDLESNAARSAGNEGALSLNPVSF